MEEFALFALITATTGLIAILHEFEALLWVIIRTILAFCTIFAFPVDIIFTKLFFLVLDLGHLRD